MNTNTNQGEMGTPMRTAVITGYVLPSNSNLVKALVPDASLLERSSICIECDNEAKVGVLDTIAMTDSERHDIEAKYSSKVVGECPDCGGICILN